MGQIYLSVEVYCFSMEPNLMKTMIWEADDGGIGAEFALDLQLWLCRRNWVCIVVLEGTGQWVVICTTVFDRSEIEKKHR